MLGELEPRSASSTTNESGVLIEVNDESPLGAGLWYTGFGTSSVARLIFGLSAGPVPGPAAAAAASAPCTAAVASSSAAEAAAAAAGEGPSIPSPEATLPAKLPARDLWRRSGVALPSESRFGLYEARIFWSSGFRSSSPGTVGKSAAGPVRNAESSKASGAGVPSLSPIHSSAPATLRRLPPSAVPIVPSVGDR